MKVRYSYLPQQFGDCEELWQELKDFVITGDFTLGKPLTEFEESFAKLIGTKFAVGVNSGTDAIKLSLKALDIGPGDEIITAANTFVATVGPICELGATPVFVDVYESTFNIDCEKLEVEVKKVIKEGKLKPKAIIPVDLFGLPARYRIIRDIAKRYDLRVIEDAAQSFGGSIGKSKVGTFGDVAATSFYPAKPLGCYGDGGAIFTNDDNLAEECKAIRLHGTKSDKYNSEMIGLNGRLDSIQAAVLLEKLTIFDEEIIMRNEVNKLYRKFLNNAQYHPQNYESAHALFSITLGSNKKRDDLIRRLSSKNIPTVVYYKFPIHLMKAFKYLGYKKDDFPISEMLSKIIVSLPMHPYLSPNEIESIIKVLKIKK